MAGGKGLGYVGMRIPCRVGKGWEHSNRTWSVGKSTVSGPSRRGNAGGTGCKKDMPRTPGGPRWQTAYGLTL